MNIRENVEPSWWIVAVLIVNSALFVMQLMLAVSVSNVKRVVADAVAKSAAASAGANVQPNEKIVNETHYVRVVLEGKGN